MPEQETPITTLDLTNSDQIRTLYEQLKEYYNHHDTHKKGQTPDALRFLISDYSRLPTQEGRIITDMLTQATMPLQRRAPEGTGSNPQTHRPEEAVFNDFINALFKEDPRDAGLTLLDLAENALKRIDQKPSTETERTIGVPIKLPDISGDPRFNGQQMVFKLDVITAGDKKTYFMNFRLGEPLPPHLRY